MLLSRNTLSYIYPQLLQLTEQCEEDTLEDRSDQEAFKISVEAALTGFFDSSQIKEKKRG